MKAEHIRLIPQKHIEKLEILIVFHTGSTYCTLIQTYSKRRWSESACEFNTRFVDLISHTVHLLAFVAQNYFQETNDKISPSISVNSWQFTKARYTMSMASIPFFSYQLSFTHFSVMVQTQKISS